MSKTVDDLVIELASMRSGEQGEDPQLDVEDACASGDVEDATRYLINAYLTELLADIPEGKIDRALHETGAWEAHEIASWDLAEKYLRLVFSNMPDRE